jgi:hypothetical protein
MIFISKLIAKFIKAVLSLLSSSEEHVETSEVIVASVGSFTSSDKIIQPLPIVNTYLLPDRGIISCVGEQFLLMVQSQAAGGLTDIYATQDFSTWSKLQLQSIRGKAYFTGRVLPAETKLGLDGLPLAFGYNKIEPVLDLGYISGFQNNSLLISREPSSEIESNKIAYLAHRGLVKSAPITFLYKGRRVYAGRHWSWTSNKLNDIQSLTSSGWFAYQDSVYQAYCPVEREVFYRRIQVPHPCAGLIIRNAVQPATLIQDFMSEQTSFGYAEDVNGNIYGLHRDYMQTLPGSDFVDNANDKRFYLTKNYVYQENFIVNSLDIGVNTRIMVDPRDKFLPTIYNGQYQKTVADLFVGETGDSDPKIACIDTNVFISQYNKIFKLNNNLELQNIYEVPFCVQQMTADIDHLYLLHKGGISKCLP